MAFLGIVNYHDPFIMPYFLGLGGVHLDSHDITLPLVKRIPIGTTIVRGYVSFMDCTFMANYHHVTFIEPLVLWKLTFGESTTDQDVNPETFRTFSPAQRYCDSLPLPNSETFCESHVNSYKTQRGEGSKGQKGTNYKSWK